MFFFFLFEDTDRERRGLMTEFMLCLSAVGQRKLKCSDGGQTSQTRLLSAAAAGKLLKIRQVLLSYSQQIPPKQTISVSQTFLTFLTVCATQPKGHFI